MNRTKERKRIAKDPFHQKILDALAGHLDPQVFEACMGDLLQDDFPGLVPVPGGNDAGMDAAIASGRGEPFPLICTTADDVRDNFEENLDSFLKRGLASRSVALATSRTLTPPETRELFGLARQKGFTLLQVFERSAVANRLYRNSVWCKRLLNLVGTPSALSVVPLSRRPFVEITLVGREADVEWLRNTSGDRVIVGEPGSGKTYLFSWLIRDGWPALFLVSDNETEIANALRDQEPEVVIVDDAHVEPRRLDRLRRLRQEVGGEFDIVASTWPGASNEVMEALGCSETQSRNLELLTRNQVLEVIRQVGVEEPDDILRSLVDQSSNKPGLAVTIARLWLQGDWQKVLNGTILSRTLLTLFRDLTGRKTTQVLASFSLGGSKGVRPSAVGQFLQEPPGEIQGVIADLSAGGVLFGVERDSLSVKPEQLRSALLREVFFSGEPTAFDYRKLLQFVPSHDRAVETIVLARLYGAVIESSELRKLVSRSKEPRLWRLLAAVSVEDAQWVLESYRGDILDIAGALLRQVSQQVIPRILERTGEAARTQERRVDTPMSILLSWIQDIEAGPREWIHRRRMVARASKEYLVSGGDGGAGIHGICISLSPTVRGESLDPGMGATVTMRSGLMSPDPLREIESIWEEVEPNIQEINSVSWRHLSSTLWDWVYPEYAARGEVEENRKRIMRTFASRLLRDLSQRAGHSPGLKAELEKLAAHVGITLALEQDPVFKLLYLLDNDELDDRQEGEDIWQEAIRSLAAEWSAKSPEEVVGIIAFYEREAQRIGRESFQGMPMLCQFMAEIVRRPEEWLDAMLGENLRRHLMSPFLERIVDLQQEAWETRLETYLDHQILDWTALSIVLKLQHPPPALLDRAFARAQENTLLVETLCLQGKVPLPTLKMLLGVPLGEVALAVAVGEWCASPRGRIHEEILPAWRAAILGAKAEEAKRNVGFRYWLGIILASDPNLAFDWLRLRLKDSDLPRFLTGDDPYSRAIRALGRKQKEELLKALSPAPILRFLLPKLIGPDQDLYRRLLEISSLANYHLKPLEGLPGKAWEDLASAALDAGYAPEEVAEAAFRLSTPGLISGSGLEYWERWDQAFAAFEDHSRWDLREVASRGRALAQVKIREAHKRQREFDLHGLGRDARSG